MFIFYRYLSHGVDEPMKNRLTLFHKKYSNVEEVTHPAFEHALELCKQIVDGKTVEAQDIEDTVSKLKRIDLEQL